MNFLSGLAKGGDSNNHKPGGEKKSSSAGLFSDAKVVAEAARAQFSNHPEKYDKAKAAGSAAHLLDAASEYGKLDETKGVGKYVHQAEDYLRRYSHEPAKKPDEFVGKPSHAGEP
ncbi:nodulin-related protein 1-like [Salvia divinorum]|uniref:Nodulin-related protein 1-like n=1 Tax=Salvia divinorum TaxID=28513 RepID=A0ABD1IMB4_SALDI